MVTNLRIAYLTPTMQAQLKEMSREEKVSSSGRVSQSRSRKTLSIGSVLNSLFPRLVLLATTHLTAPEMPKLSAKVKSWNFNLSLFTESIKVTISLSFYAQQIIHSSC